jgi:hypothetical protein
MRILRLSLAASIVFLTILAIYSCNNAKGPAGKLLKLGLEKGKSYDYEITWNTDQQVMGNEHRINITSGYTLQVLDDKAGVKTMRARYSNFKMYMKIMSMEMNVDTEKSLEPVNEAEMNANPLGMMDRIFAGIKGKEFLMTVNKEGQVVEVRGFDQIINEMTDSAGAGEDNSMQIKASLADQFNEQGIKDQFAQVFSIFPNKEIKVGDSWQKNFQTGGRMPAHYKTKYTVKEIEGDHAMLTAETGIDAAGETEIKGTQNGNLLVDINSGLVLNAEFHTDIVAKSQGVEVIVKSQGMVKGKEK